MNRRDALIATTSAALCFAQDAASAAQESRSMTHRPINPTSVAYAGACEIASGARLLFISGQVPQRQDGSVPSDFATQCRVAWANVEQQLKDAGMSLDNLVKVTTFLSDRRYRAENSGVRREVLKERTPALTIIIADIYDEAWLLEIEAVAAA
jgi:2-iminobutanoate/2-iminopropanoate deaminase